MPYRLGRRLMGSVAAPAVEDLSDRLDAGLTEAHERSIAFVVHASERSDALAAQLVDVEARLAELEVDRARLHEAVRRLQAGDDPVSADVAYWRRRLTGAGPAPSLERLGDVARVVTDVGALLLPAHDEVMLSFMRQFGEWEREESDHLRSLLRPGMTFVDVGAHVGYMSLLAARAVGPTGRGFALEPEPGNFRLLTANLATHGVDNVVPIPAAAWCESGSLSLSLCRDNTGDHRAYAVAGRETVEVPAFALDDIVPEDVRVDVVKVDAQGTDDIAIRGMERTLARCWPAMVVEFWPDGIAQRGADPMEVLEYYRGLAYDVAVLGRDPAPLRAVLDAALASSTEFCTLVLTPCA